MATIGNMVDLLDPTAESDAVSMPISKRIDSLNGKVIGMLDNGKSNFDNLLEDFEAIVREKYPTATVLRRRKPSVAAGCPADTMKELLEKCDVLITGLGD